MSGIVFALLSSVLFALSSLALKKSARTISSSLSFFINTILGLLIYIPSSFILGISTQNIITAIPYAFLSALLSEAFYFFVIRKGKLAITSTILSSAPIYTVILAYLFLGERLTGMQLVSVIMVIIGTISVSIPHSRIALYYLLGSLPETTWPLLGAVAIGFSDVTSKYILDQTTDFSFLFLLAIMQVPIAFLYLKFENTNMKNVFSSWKKNTKLYQYAVYGALFNVLGVVLYWLSFHFTMASIASPLVSTYGGITVVFALIFLREKLTKPQGFGIVLLTIGVLLLSFIS